MHFLNVSMWLFETMDEEPIDREGDVRKVTPQTWNVGKRAVSEVESWYIIKIH